MTPEERATRLVLDHNITQTVGSKHENPAEAVRLITAAIREAVAAERERCAAIIDREREADGDPEQLRNLLAEMREEK